jgi:methyl-accepting chemotaxis protein
MTPIFRWDRNGGNCAVNPAPLQPTMTSRTPPIRIVGGAAAAGAIALLAYHLSGNLQIGAVMLFCTSVLFGLLERRMWLRGCREQAAVIEALEALGNGDRSIKLEASALGELAGLATPFNDLADALRRSGERVEALAEELVELPNRIAGAFSELSSGADDQEAAVEETSSLLANINASIRGINAEIVNLAVSNEESASSIMEMGTAIEQVASSAAVLRDTVESSTSSVHELNAQIRRVSESGDAVEQVAEETAAAITEMDHAIREVGEHVRGAAELTEQVSASAEEGANAVGATIDGIAQIRDLTLDAKTALEGLADRIGAIGQIASVINGISDETNLLSLNAAIIAAQAGEHGKPFAVVAEQVKTLARRTTSSTKEIEALIESIQEQSENAVLAMGAGIDAVEQGVQRSRGAGEALERIRGTAADASGRVAEITRATEEQAINSRHVAEAAQTTSVQVQQISAALSEQSTATEQILSNSNHCVELCRQMSAATEGQRTSSRYITDNIAKITDLIASIQSKTASHEQASNGVAESVVSMLGTARKSSERIPEVARGVIAMRDRAAELRVQAGSSKSRSAAPDTDAPPSKA